MKPVKLLNPRSSDTNVMGGEPPWKTQPTENRISALSKAFSWYNYFYGKKDAREMIVNYLESCKNRSNSLGSKKQSLRLMQDQDFYLFFCTCVC